MWGAGGAGGRFQSSGTRELMHLQARVIGVTLEAAAAKAARRPHVLANNQRRKERSHSPEQTPLFQISLHTPLCPSVNHFPPCPITNASPIFPLSRNATHFFHSPLFSAFIFSKVFLTASAMTSGSRSEGSMAGGWVMGRAGRAGRVG